MAYMMELPMVIILVQRLGPATGTATCGAQGDISLINGMISGGYSIPTISTSDMNDCWEMAETAVRTAVALRSPVVLLTSKEEVMTLQSFDQSSLKEISRVQRTYFNGSGEYSPYKAGEDLIPPFLPVSDPEHQVRITASTHNIKGILQNTTKEALDNTKRLHNKVVHHLNSYLHFEADEQGGAKTLLFSWGITANACREAVSKLRDRGSKVSLLIGKTLLPVPDVYYSIFEKYDRVIFAEENYTGQYRQIMMGARHDHKFSGINGIGKMITPDEIMEEVKRYE
jgi:2-oxoglutarate ferredoxin oxidoreductase subunit alpha